MPAMLRAVLPVLAAADVATSIHFFRDLGFAPVFEDAPGQPTYAVLARDGVQIHLQYADPTQWDRRVDRPVYRFIVDDVDALYAEFAAKERVVPGGRWSAPADTPWGTREFHLHDPGRNVLQFYRVL